MAVTILVSLFAYLTIRTEAVHRALAVALAGIGIVFALSNGRQVGKAGSTRRCWTI